MLFFDVGEFIFLEVVLFMEIIDVNNVGMEF